MLTDLKEIEKFLKLCRKQGVKSVDFEGLKIEFGDLPSKPSERTEEEIETDSLTEDQLAFYHLSNAGQTS